MKEKIKHIEPGFGLGKLLFGLNKNQVLDIIGQADRSFKDAFDDKSLVEVWEYDELGLSLRFDGEEVLELTSMSIISSYFEYNGVSLIGKNIEEVKKVLKDAAYQLVLGAENKDQKLIYSKKLSLMIIFDYDVATSLSWDPSEMSPEYARKLQKLGIKKSRTNILQTSNYKRKKKLYKSKFTLDDFLNADKSGKVYLADWKDINLLIFYVVIACLGISAGTSFVFGVLAFMKFWKLIKGSRINK